MTSWREKIPVSKEELGNSLLFVSCVDMEKNKWKSSFFFLKMVMSNGRALLGIKKGEPGIKDQVRRSYSIKLLFRVAMNNNGKRT